MLPAFPETLAPPAPFPLVVAQSRETAFVAPGIARATYRLQTSDGPLVVNVVAIDPHEKTVRLGGVLANGTLVSGGETISSMARRTNAVAGVNADYFDIGNTNQPLNIVVDRGALLRTPSKRIALDVRTDGSVAIDRFSFSGSVAYDGTTIPLTTVNEWPPEGGASFLTPAYGALKTAPGVSIAQVVAADVAHVATTIAGTYRVASVEPSSSRTVMGPLLAFGPAAQAIGPLPNAGDAIVVSAATVPPLDSVASAVGGGPLLLSGGASVDDPNAPAPEESAVHFPVSGAGLTGTGGVLLVAVDGREPAISVGVTRPQFAALFLGLGANDAMAFDSGGSATLVARRLGDATASVLNTPSDGAERPVADGLFAYSDAPLGPAAQLVVRPASIVALPHVTVALRAIVVDAAGHPLGDADLGTNATLVVPATSSQRTVSAARVHGTVAIDVVDRVERATIAADRRDPDPGARVALTATGFDDRGRSVDLGDAVRWSADGARISASGTLDAPAHDIAIAARVPGATARYELLVGRHDVPLPVFDAAHAAGWEFASAPAASPGSVTIDAPNGTLALAYDFSGGERAAYARADVALPGEPLVLALDVRGDRSGASVRASFVNRFGERRALTLVPSIDWNGWQMRAIAIPDDLNPPVRWRSVYVVDRAVPTRAAGTIAFRNANLTVAGTP